MTHPTRNHPLSAMKTAIQRIILSLGLASIAQAAPNVADEMLTDVTPRGFSVVWTTNEPATASLSVFSDAAGTIPVAGAAVEAHQMVNGSGSVRVSAENLGVMKASVSNLASDTIYYYRTVSMSKADSTTTTGPPTPARTARQPLRTQAAQGYIPLANPLLKFDAFLPDGTTPAEGALLIVTVPGAASPVSAFAGGDGVPAPTVIVDLNNLYDAATRDTLVVRGGEAVTLTLEMGSFGREKLPFFLPGTDSLARVQDPHLTPVADSPPVVKPRVTTSGLAQVFLDFPATKGKIYEVQYTQSLDSDSWVPVTPAIPAEGPRIFWYDNGAPRTSSHPMTAPVRFYRIRELSTAP